MIEKEFKEIAEKGFLLKEQFRVAMCNNEIRKAIKIKKELDKVIEILEKGV
ncbi:MAG: hypothetical protein PHF21_04500 [Bacilli bacterium]|nr:hypothetical protein [Bacilli bacterium]